ncbi:MAG: type IV toxin-antitoxin system AbiEi family antitoxin domain-containing protein [Capsulimonas sp.]|uniref:type IV toxin-antitoxin system AbiEi family antitoxin domain-containing protein n=1 Tax=Capsulimonas sp. TaxID=2494211 RepID=UPI003266BAE0
METKINKILRSWPSGTVALSSWLEEMEVSRQLQQSYQSTDWIASIGHGAFRRPGDAVDWLGGLYAIQKQAHLNIHVGGRTALGLLGQAHYLELNPQAIQLFSPRNVNLPTWFKNYDWGAKLQLRHTDFLPPHVGLVDVESKLFTVRASSAARAIMECLYLAPDTFDLMEAYQIMEGLDALRPIIVQQLLEQCRSIKVKRLFLFMAEQAGHAWVRHLDRSQIEIGHGKRSLVPGGVYVPKYQITVPRELVKL